MSRYTIFQHWIFKDKKPLYEKDGSILMGDMNTLAKPDGQLAKLRKSPTTWRNITVKYGRSNKYLGLFRDFTDKLTFVQDGAKIIKDALWRIGFEASLIYGLGRWDQYVFPPKYDAYYSGEIDLTKIRQTRESIEVTVVEGGPAKYLKAFEGTTYEIPVYLDPEAVTVYLDGLPFTNKIVWKIYDDQDFDGSAVFQLGMGITVQEGTTQGILTHDQQYQVGLSAQPNNDYYLGSLTKNLTAKHTGSITVYMGTSIDLPLIVRKVKIVDGVATTVTNYDLSVGVLSVGNHVIDMNIDVPMSAGEYLYLHVRGDAGSPGTDFNIVSGTLTVNYDVTFDPTFCKALKPRRLAEKLVEKMTSGKHTLTSDFLDALDKVVYTSGMAIRNFTDEKSVIKISFNDFYQSLRRFAVRLGVKNDIITIEAMATAFNSTVIANLGTVANFTITVANDMIYNTIKNGYQDQNYDSVNGLDEFNVGQQWTTPIVKEIKELDLVSPVRADMYGIELTRLNLSGKDTTDSSADNDTFFLSVEKGATIVYYNGPFVVSGGNTIEIPGDHAILTGNDITIPGLGTFTVTGTSFLVVGHTLLTVSTAITNGSYNTSISYDNTEVYKLYRPTYDSITGLLHPAQAFNVELSPKRGLLNNGAFIRSFVEDPAALIKFQTGDKNSELSTELAGVTITEKEDIQVSDLPDPLYLPYYFEMDTEVPVNYKTIIEANPYGTIEFNDEKGNPFFMFMWDGDIKLGTNERQRWKGLCSPRTNKLLLI